MHQPSQTVSTSETQVSLNCSQSTTLSTSQASDEPDEEEDSGEEVLEKSQDASVCRFFLSDTFLLTKLQVPPKTPAQVSGRKRAASATPVSNVKKSRTTPAEKLFTGISTSMEHVSEVLSAAFPSSSNTLPPTPVHKQTAIKNAMRLERTWLTGCQLVSFINVLEKETFAAEGYEVVMEDEDLRKEWVKMKLNILGDE